MNKNDAGLVAKNRAMFVAFQESILEASEDELREAFRDEGRNLDEEAACAQGVIERAFQQAGIALPKAAMVNQQHFGDLLSVLRRKKKLTVAELAVQAGVPLEDVQQSESDKTFMPSLRTLARLEDFFNLKERTLSILAGAIRVQNDAVDFHERVEQFRWAAFSRGMGKLSREEKKQLNEIIRFLSNYTE